MIFNKSTLQFNFSFDFCAFVICMHSKSTKIDAQIQGDVYTGTDTVEYLADGVPDRVFFATNSQF